MRKALIAALAVSFMAGCSSVPVAQAPIDDNVDYQYIAYVESASKRYRTTVVWLNLPQKRTVVTTQ